MSLLAPKKPRALPLLEVDDLTVEIRTPNGVIRAVEGLSYELQPGEILGVVGESGSGKTVGALALLGLLPKPNAKVTRGRVVLDGRDLLALGRRELRAARGQDLSIIFQDPLASLNPVFTIERQLIDAVVAHGGTARRRARDRAHELLQLVGVQDGPRRARQYPHQWSGGMRQRALIAMAIANRPRLVVADEPTTALDVTIQAQVLETLQTAQRQSGAAMMLITHDLAQVAQLADRVLVMYAGRIVEHGPVDEILSDPQHPYTRGLLGSVPRMARSAARLQPIPGNPPSLLDTPAGCAFEPRCDVGKGRQPCRDELPLLLPAPNEHHRAACHYRCEHGDSASSPRPPDPRREVAGDPKAGPLTAATTVATPRSQAAVEPSPEPTEVVVVRTEALCKEYELPRTGLRSGGRIRAVDDVSITMIRGATLGLVGESGCGKSTLAWMVAGLTKPDSGRVDVHGVDITTHDRTRMRAVRRKLQIVFQDPMASLSPRMLVDDILQEPLAIHGVGETAQRRERVTELLDLVGLDKRHGRRYPHELSGGQRQRVAIARALALDTEILILDEPVSALDVSIQAQIIRLLQDLQQELGLSLLLISHDLAVVHALSQQVAVMYLGRIVESGARDALYERPLHPYTRALLAAAPRLERRDDSSRPRFVLGGETPGSFGGTGCRFRDRCWRAEEVCSEVDPPLVSHEGSDHAYACHFPDDGPLPTGAASA